MKSARILKMVLNSYIQVSSGADIKLGNGAIVFSAGVAECGTSGCASDAENVDGNDAVDRDGRSLFIDGSLDTDGAINLRAADNITINKAMGSDSTISSVSLRAGHEISASDTITTASGGGGLFVSSGDETLTQSSQEDPSLPALTGPSEDIEGDSPVTFNENVTLEGALNSQGADIQLNAGGTVTVSNNVTTAGGEFMIGTDAGEGPVSFTHNGGSINTSSGDLTITTDTGGSLGNITTSNLNLNRSGSAGSYSLVQSADTNLAVAGTTSVEVGEGTVTLANEENHFEGNWSLTEAGTVGIRDDGDIQIDVGSVAGP
ncbi:hypothetical protein, partial [Marinimicrobium locisalis]|uniref:hypothetical protein n=1 Tax=Marinimicrobium locisalis TaxID=546022 RepID=UPI003222092E